MFKYIFEFFRPKTVEEAARKKLHLSIVYAIVGWHAFMYMFYLTVIKDIPTDSEGRKNAIINKLGQGKNVQLMRIEGFKIVEDRTVHVDSPETEKNEEQQLKC